MTVKAGRPSAGWIRLAAMVARSCGRVAKLCTGPPPVRAGSYLRGDAGDPDERRQPRWPGLICRA